MVVSRRQRAEIVPFAKLLATLSTLRRRDALSEFDSDVYEAQLADLPIGLLSAAVDRMMRVGTTDGWFPTAPEWRAVCETIRQELRNSQRFDGCEQCNGTGWDKVVIAGVQRLARCQCWKAYQQRLGELEQIAPMPLPAGRVEPNDRLLESGDLPEQVRESMARIAGRKGMR